MKNEPIIMNSLLEEREALERIIDDQGNLSNRELKERIIDWANDLLLAAGDSEPGLLELIPQLPNEEENPSKKHVKV